MYEEYAITVGEALRKYVDEFLEGGALDNTDQAFRSGYRLALHRVVTLMQQTAEAYGVPLERISLDDLSEQKLLA